jgi:hypothetical protein
VSILDERIRLDNVIVRQYLYRTATVRDRIMSIPRNQLKHLEEELAKASEARVDNHTVYELRSYNGDVIYVMFTDDKAHFGFKVEERRW